MRTLRPIRYAGTSAVVVLLTSLAVARAVEPAREQVEFFEKKIRPVLVEQCYKCHSARADKVRGGLLLDSRDGLLKGGESGPAVTPGKPHDSLLLKAIRYEDHEMPPKSKLPDAVIADFQTWIRLGASDSRDGRATAAIAKTVDV